MKTLFYCLLISYLGIWASCNKSFDCAENVYSFGLGIRAYPDKDSIHVGDTVWFEINEPTTLKDLQSGTDVDYSGAENLGSFVSFSELVNADPKWIDAASKFSFKLNQGSDVTSANFGLGREYIFDERNGRYVFKLGIIPKQNGIFSILFSNAANVYRNNNKCPKASFGLNFVNTDQHYYLSPFYTGGPTPVGGDYYFKVY
jgi:hypothetical protein